MLHCDSTHIYMYEQNIYKTHFIRQHLSTLCEMRFGVFLFYFILLLHLKNTDPETRSWLMGHDPRFEKHYSRLYKNTSWQIKWTRSICYPLQPLQKEIRQETRDNIKILSYLHCFKQNKNAGFSICNVMHTILLLRRQIFGMLYLS